MRRDQTDDEDFFDDPPRSYKEIRFRRFHAGNPGVLKKIVSIARFLRHEREVKRTGIEAIYCKMRWDHLVETKGDTFLLNDHFTSYYARLAMHVAPDLADLFELRKQRSHFDPSTVWVEPGTA